MSHPAPNRKTRAFSKLIAAVVTALMLAAACGSDTDLDEAVDDSEQAVDAVTEDGVSEDEAEEAQTSLASALESAGLTSLSSAVADIDISQLTDADEYTFFAPNDDAFTSLTSDQMADLVSDPAMLVDILRNHVVPAKVDSASLVGMSSVTTEAGNELAVTVDGDTVMVGDATVVDTDVDAGAGVVHVIDTLLIP